MSCLFAGALAVYPTLRIARADDSAEAAKPADKSNTLVEPVQFTPAEPMSIEILSNQTVPKQSASSPSTSKSSDEATKSWVPCSVNLDADDAKSIEKDLDVKLKAIKSMSADYDHNSNSDCCGCDDDNSCCKCCDCGPPGRFWIREEYVNWWAQGGHAPALVVTSPDPSFTTTRTLYGDADYNGGYRPGTWTDMGMWLDCCKTIAIEGDYFWAGDLNSPFFASSNGDPILGRPFIDANTGLPRFQDIAVPGIVVGSIGIKNDNNMQGAGIDFRHNLCCCCGCCQDCCDTCNFHGQNCSRLDCIAGFRWFNFDDNLRIDEHLTSIDPASGVPIGTTIDVTDSFRTQNNFYGMELGVVGTRYSCRWMLEGSAKVAFGDMQKLAEINGQTVISFPGTPTTVLPGGLLALSSNIGHYEQDQFTAIPIIAGRIGYRVCDHMTLLAGYTFMYFGNVARAGDQIDTTVNPNLIPPPIGGGPNRPAFAFHNSSLWMQGVTLGAEFNF
jgi:hypothetical protein